MPEPLIGLFSETSIRGAREPRDYYRALGKQLVLADELGFDFFGLTQNFGRDSVETNFSISPDPLTFFAAHIPLTKRIRALTAILVGPLHHPAVALSQAALVDNLSDGRVILGVGRGHPWIYDRIGVPQEESRPRMAQFLEITRLLLDQPDQRHTVEGRIWSLRDFELWPKFVQPELPVFVAAARSAGGAEDAAARGFGLLMPTYLGMAIDQAENQIDVYRAASRAAGHSDGRVLLGVQVYAHADAELAVQRGAETFAAQMHVFKRDVEMHVEQLGPEYPGYKEMGGQFDQLSDPAFVREKFQRDWPLHLSTWGDRSIQLAKFEELIERVRPQGLILNIDAGGVPYDWVDESIRYFGEQVLPDIRAMLARVR